MRVFETQTTAGSELFSSIVSSFRDEYHKNLGDNTVLAREMFSSGCRLRLSQKHAYLSSPS